MTKRLPILVFTITLSLIGCSEDEKQNEEQEQQERLTFCECMKKDREMRKEVKALSDPAEQAKVKDKYSEVLSQCEDLAANMSELEIDEALKNCDIE